MPPSQALAVLFAPASRMAMVALVVACSSPDPFRIGVVLGGDGIVGAKLAAESVNVAGGIRGQTLELVTLPNWETSARAALTAADSLTNDSRILAVVGHANSSSSLAASQVYNAAHLVQIAPTSTAPLYRSAGPYSFRLVASHDSQAIYLVREIARRAPRFRTALLWVNDDYGRSLHSAVVARAEAQGVPLVYDEPYIEGDGFLATDHYVGAFGRARPDVLLWLGRGYALRAFLAVIKRNGPRLSVIGSDGIGGLSDLCCAPGSQSVSPEITYVRLLDPAIQSPAMNALRARYRERIPGGEITDEAAFSYDAVLLLAQAIRVAGPHRERIREYLATLGRTAPGYVGVTGLITFDDDGDPPARFFMDRIPSPSSRPSGAITW